jgi:hypothetical protein
MPKVRYCPDWKKRRRELTTSLHLITDSNSQTLPTPAPNSFVSQYFSTPSSLIVASSLAKNNVKCILKTLLPKKDNLELLDSEEEVELMRADLAVRAVKRRGMGRAQARGERRVVFNFSVI